MKHIKISARLLFMQGAEMSFFNFPIVNPINVSFWIEGDKVSTFSRVTSETGIINVGELTFVTIVLVERDFLLNRIVKGTVFKLGGFPFEIATGEVLEVTYL